MWFNPVYTVKCFDTVRSVIRAPQVTGTLLNLHLKLQRLLRWVTWSNILLRASGYLGIELRAEQFQIQHFINSQSLSNGIESESTT